MATLQAELERETKETAGKESEEAIAALRDFAGNGFSAKVKKFWHLPRDIPDNLSVKLFIKMDKQGKVVKATIKQSSGQQSFDTVALKAVKDASPLPLPKHPDAIDALVSDGIIITFSP
ncbi:MAG: TonB family protein [Cardiobacteriaceae bacterium]|nr:TonB family protein [Cardiobacteriaceae bacterium]